MTVVVGCSARWGHERSPCQDWFTVADENDVIDVGASFAPSGWLPILLKLAATVYVNFVWFMELLDYDQKGMFFAFLSNWALTFSMVYTWTSLVNSFLGAKQPRRYTDNVPGRIAIQWYLFNLAALTSMFAIILWWYDVYDKGETTIHFLNLSIHGGTLLVLLLEGFVVNRIPIRRFFWWGTGLPFGLAYGLWTWIHSGTDIGNPNEPDSDLLYDRLDWEDEWGKTLAIVLVSVLIIAPILQSILFCLSLYGMPICCGRNIRRYTDEESDDSQKSDLSESE